MNNDGNLSPQKVIGFHVQIFGENIPMISFESMCVVFILAIFSKIAYTQKNKDVEKTSV